MIKVTPRARVHQDKAGDPLDGLVNMFDIGIVLAVAFLLAALSSLGLSGAVSEGGLTKPTLGEVVIQPGETQEDVPDEGVKTAGRGTPVGTVYRLADGRLIYVTGDGTTAPVTPDSAVPTDPSAEPDSGLGDEGLGDEGLGSDSSDDSLEPAPDQLGQSELPAPDTGS